MVKMNHDFDNRGNRIDEPSSAAVTANDEDADLNLDESPEPLPEQLTIQISKSLHRKIRDNAREEGVSIDEMISELLAEGVVLRAWEIVERKHTMRGGANQNNFNRNPQSGHVNGNNMNGNGGNHGNTQQGSQQHRPQFQQGGNRQAQKKLQRQARQHANAMDLLQDKAAFIEYVRNQEKKRR